MLNSLPISRSRPGHQYEDKTNLYNIFLTQMINERVEVYYFFDFYKRWFFLVRIILTWRYHTSLNECLVSCLQTTEVNL